MKEKIRIFMPVFVFFCSALLLYTAFLIGIFDAQSKFFIIKIFSFLVFVISIIIIWYKIGDKFKFKTKHILNALEEFVFSISALVLSKVIFDYLVIYHSYDYSFFIMAIIISLVALFYIIKYLPISRGKLKRKH